MDEIRFSKKFKNADFYLISFIVSFAAFFLLREIIMLIIMTINEGKEDGFSQIFLDLWSSGKYEDFSQTMWGTINLSQFLGNLLLLIPLIILLAKAIFRDLKIFKSELWHNIAVVIFGFALMFFGQSFLARVYQYFDIYDTSDNQALINFALQSDTKIFIIFSVVVLAPLLEELVFRKLFFGFLEEKLKFPRILVLFLSAALFASLHALDIFFFQYFFMALILAGSYVLSKKNIIIPIGIHFLNNAMILLYVFNLIQ